MLHSPNPLPIRIMPDYTDISRSIPPEVFLEKKVLERCSKLTGAHPCQKVISINLLCNFIEITLWHGCSPVNLLHIFRTFFYKNTYGRLLLHFTLYAFRRLALLQWASRFSQFHVPACKVFIKFIWKTFLLKSPSKIVFRIAWT